MQRKPVSRSRLSLQDKHGGSIGGGGAAADEDDQDKLTTGSRETLVPPDVEGK